MIGKYQQWIRALFSSFIFIGVLAGCSTINQYDDLNPVTVSIPTVLKDEHQATGELDDPKQKPQRKKLAIAFGGGAARGVMHLGVIKALEEAGIRADIVTGTSIGSIAAVLYSSNDTYDQMENVMYDFSEFSIADVVISSTGILNGKALAKWINQHASYDNLEESVIPIGIVATDLTKHKIVMFTEGNPGKAAQTSSSVPGVFTPVYNHDSILVDGGVLSLVPVYAARTLGADIVIGVDVFCGMPPPLSDSALDTMANTFWLQSCVSTQAEVSSADIVIRPMPLQPSLINFGDKSDRKVAVDIGYQATLAILPELKERLK